jgi:hypothetical protein
MGEKEHFEHRFGLVAVKKGFVTSEQFIKAVDIQFKENLSSLRHRRIGEIFVDMGLMSESQVNEVLETLSKGNSLSED